MIIWNTGVLERLLLANMLEQVAISEDRKKQWRNIMEIANLKSKVSKNCILLDLLIVELLLCVLSSNNKMHSAVFGSLISTILSFLCWSMLIITFVQIDLSFIINYNAMCSFVFCNINHTLRIQLSQNCIWHNITFHYKIDYVANLIENRSNVSNM